MCLDYGRKRVGIAVSDPLRIIAGGLETVSASRIRDYLRSYLSGEEVDRLVVGYPKTVRNEPSEATRYINPFLKWFRGEFPEIPVDLYDERFTSRMAERSLLEAGVPRSARKDKSLVDKISASLILQSYMEAEGLRNRRNEKRLRK